MDDASPVTIRPVEPIIVAAFVAVLAAVLVAAVIPVIWFVVVVLADSNDD